MFDKHRWVTWALLAGIGVVLVASYLVGAHVSGGEAFAGTDEIVTSQLADQGVRSWFPGITGPRSPEIESGLFALQAAVGAGVLGYVLISLRSRASKRAADDHRTG